MFRHKRHDTRRGKKTNKSRNSCIENLNRARGTSGNLARTRRPPLFRNSIKARRHIAESPKKYDDNVLHGGSQHDFFFFFLFLRAQLRSDWCTIGPVQEFKGSREARERNLTGRPFFFWGGGETVYIGSAILGRSIPVVHDERPEPLAVDLFNWDATQRPAAPSCFVSWARGLAENRSPPTDLRDQEAVQTFLRHHLPAQIHFRRAEH
ncbi:hypothetical protein HD554DRAFT_258982 [Boletus coccyginus]|nr:hypothetical protein HD554DRAFT_258982 [Boletus coccyginus]